MARYAYDVNTTQRYIDVHKQFQGGLKTVDTDDSLGAVFLREAENVSLSEFGFIEKRYGTYENFKKQISGTTFQGYFEFKEYIIYVIDGKFYVNNETTHRAIQKEKPDEWRYPTLPPYPFEAPHRDVNGVSVNDVLYIFTGVYPVYAKVVDEELKFYWFSVDIPSYDKIVVTGHNLLENDYEPLYFEDQTQLLVDSESVNPTSTVNYLTFEEANKASYPKLPYVFDPDADVTEKDGKVYFKSGYKYNEILDGSPQTGTPFTGQEGQDLYILNLASLQFRSSGPGSSTLDFVEGSKDNVDFIQFSNISGDLNQDLVLVDQPIVTKQTLTEVELGTELPNFTPPSVFRHWVTDNLGTNQSDTFDHPFVRDHTIEKFVDIAKIDVDFTKKYGVTLEWQKEVDDPNTAENDAVYETIDFESLKENVRNIYQTLIDDTTLEYISNNVNITESLVRPAHISRLSTLNSRLNRIEITAYNADGVFFTNKVFVDHFNIEYIAGKYIFKFPENVLQTDEVAGYRIKLIAPVYYVYSEPIYNLLNLTYDPVEFNFYATTPDVVVASLESMLTIPQGSTNTFGTDIVELSVTNLISGLYDFRFAFDILKYTVEDGYLVKKDSETIFTDTFFNIQITQEKLKDFPRKDANSIGIEYPTLKPIWTCNKVIEHFGKLMVWGSTEMPTAVFYSFPDRPTFFPSKFYLDFQNDEGAAIENVTSYMNILVAQTADRTWGIRGNSGLIDSPAPYVPFTINPTVGTIAYKSVRPVRNHLFFLSKQGIIALKSLYAADEQYNIEFVDLNIRNIVPQDAKAVGIQYDNQYWLNFPNFGITLRWYIDKKAWVLDNFNTWDTFKGLHKWQIKNGQLEFITYPSRLKESENLSIYKVGVDYSLPTDLGETTVAKFETSFLNQNYPFHPKNYKETKLDFTLQNEYNISKDVIYFEENQDIDEVKYLNNVSLIKNHRYRIYFYRLPKDLDIPTLIEIYPKEKFENNVVIPLTETYNANVVLETPDTQPEEGSQQHIAYLEFLIPNDINGEVDIKLNFPENTFLEDIDLDVRDSTYDNVLNFLIWVLSENNTLNQDFHQGYNQEKISLQDRLGDWEFGQTDFGKKVTAVNTIKLSGKGYNVKIFMEDYSKSKWTLESLGITYKMRRARSR